MIYTSRKQVDTYAAGPRIELYLNPSWYLINQAIFLWGWFNTPRVQNQGTQVLKSTACCHDFTCTSHIGIIHNAKMRKEYLIKWLTWCRVSTFCCQKHSKKPSWLSNPIAMWAVWCNYHESSFSKQDIILRRIGVVLSDVCSHKS